MKEELETILAEFIGYPKEDDITSGFDQALTSIINLVDEEVIGEDTPRKLRYYDEVEQENVYYLDESGSIRVTENELRAKQRAKLKGVSNE